MKGILFTQDNIRLIREGKKTQTRRLMNPQPADVLCTGDVFVDWNDERGHWHTMKPRYLPGELVYVKEAWYQDPSGKVSYRLDSDEWLRDCDSWHSPLFLPEKFARTFLRIKDVRPERLQDITEEDAKGEGADLMFHLNSMQTPWDSYKMAYCQLWDSINERHGVAWCKNPWVWRIEFGVEAL